MFWYILIPISFCEKKNVIPVDFSTESAVICYVRSCIINFFALACIPFQSYILLTDTTRQKLNAISDK
jgi:hypothetical protein